jgi:hypothetical protein
MFKKETMKNNSKKTITIIIISLLSMTMFSCGSGEITPTQAATEPTESESSSQEEVSPAPEATAPPVTQAPVTEEPASDIYTSTAESPCDLDFDRVDENVEVKGRVMFVDDNAPDVLYADLEDGMCHVGITISTGDFSTWSDEEKKAFNVGSEIVVTGALASYPMPFRPEMQQLVIDIDKAPVVFFGAEASPKKLDDLAGDPCLFPPEMVGKAVVAAGEILFVDDGTAAGLYAEMQSGECVYRLWVERTSWETWSEEEKAVFSMGKFVEVEGILTIVLNEQNIDLSFPPILKND